MWSLGFIFSVFVPAATLTDCCQKWTGMLKQPWNKSQKSGLSNTSNITGSTHLDPGNIDDNKECRLTFSNVTRRVPFFHHVPRLTFPFMSREERETGHLFSPSTSCWLTSALPRVANQKPHLPLPGPFETGMACHICPPDPPGLSKRCRNCSSHHSIPVRLHPEILISCCSSSSFKGSHGSFLQSQ